MVTPGKNIGRIQEVNRDLEYPGSAVIGGDTEPMSPIDLIADKGIEFEISVNRKPVFVIGPLTTGREIKVDAVDRGVAIDLDFQLAKVTHEGVHEIVGDDDKVDVTEYKTFVATAPDDNS